MEILIGLIASALMIAISALFALRYRAIANAIYAACFLRMATAWLVGLRLLDIPGTTSDAISFEQTARQWARLPWADLLARFDTSSSFLISFVGALIYKLTAPSPVMLNIVNAIVSVYAVVLTYRLCLTLFDSSRARIVAWIAAVFPYAVLYGSVYRREIFGSVLFMLGLFQVIAWLRKSNPIYLLSALALFLLAGLFHGGFVAAVPATLLVALYTIHWQPGNVSLKTKHNRRLSSAIGVFILAVAAAGLLVSGFEVNKIGNLAEFDLTEAIEYRVADRVSTGGSSYPGFLTGVDPFSNPIVIPGRVVYFLLSPFPWDIRSPSHVLGLFASFTFLYIAISIFKSRKRIMQDPATWATLVITSLVVLGFAISIDNIGTSIRHRTKFVFVLLALCGSNVFTTAISKRRLNPASNFN